MLLKSDIGRRFDTTEGSPPLGTGVTCASLNEPGTFPRRRDVLKNVDKAGDISLAISRKMRLLIPSGPDDLPRGRRRRTDSTWSAVILIVSRWLRTGYVGMSGRTTFCSSMTV